MNSLPLQILSSLGIASGTMLVLAGNASAFTFTTNLAPGSTDPQGNIFLDSVTYNGSTVSDFTLVSGATIVSNTPVVPGDISSGGASADIGDKATVGTVKNDLQPGVAEANNAVVTNLGNLNLNSIIDTEDKGSFIIDVNFAEAVDNLLFFERGMNSKLQIQAFAADGTTLLGSALPLDSSTWQYAGFDIDTTEVNGAQKVGSLGVTAKDLGAAGPISKIRLISLGSSFNGPDFKVIGTKDAEKVPEPGMMLGLGILGSAFFVKRYRRA